jgi:hypothetical protein
MKLKYYAPKFYSVSVPGLNNHFLTIAQNKREAKQRVVDDLHSLGCEERLSRLDAQVVDIDQSNSPHFS